MKKILLGAIATILAMPIFAKTLRVNNTPGSGAQYTTLTEAMTAAEDGDVIIVDGSNTSYGDLEIDKQVTIQGPGYFLEVNGYDNSAASFGKITITADGAKITGLLCKSLSLGAKEIIVTRCYIEDMGVNYEKVISTKCVIHQNYIEKLNGSGYIDPATFFQVTNNIIVAGFGRLDQSVISHNTFLGTDGSGLYFVSNSVFSYNLGDVNYSNDGGNTEIDNKWCNTSDYGYYPTDTKVKTTDATFSTSHGAFSGDDPYVLAGKTTGVHIKSVSIPESVVQGETLEGHITIELSR